MAALSLPTSSFFYRFDKFHSALQCLLPERASTSRYSMDGRQTWTHCSNDEFVSLMAISRVRQQMEKTSLLDPSFFNTKLRPFLEKLPKSFPFEAQMLCYFVGAHWGNCEDFSFLGQNLSQKLLRNNHKAFWWQFQFLLKQAQQNCTASDFLLARQTCALLLTDSTDPRFGAGLLFHSLLEQIGPLALPSIPTVELLEQSFLLCPEMARTIYLSAQESLKTVSSLQDESFAKPYFTRTVELLSKSATGPVLVDFAQAAMRSGNLGALFLLEGSLRDILTSTSPELGLDVTWGEFLFLYTSRHTDLDNPEPFQQFKQLLLHHQLSFPDIFKGFETGEAFIRLTQRLDGSTHWMALIKEGLILKPSLCVDLPPHKHPLSQGQSPEGFQLLMDHGFYGPHAELGQLNIWQAALEVWERDASKQATRINEPIACLNLSRLLTSEMNVSLRSASLVRSPSDDLDSSQNTYLSRAIQARALDLAIYAAESLPENSPQFSIKNKQGKTAFSYALGQLSILKSRDALNKASALCKILADKKARLPDPKAFDALILRNSSLLRSNPALISALEGYALLGKESKSGVPALPPVSTPSSKCRSL